MNARPVQAFLARMTLEIRRKKFKQKFKTTNIEIPLLLRSRHSEHAQCSLVKTFLVCACPAAVAHGSNLSMLFRYLESKLGRPRAESKSF